MMTLLAFLSALAVLIAVHEYGHYRVAVACGVKVLRFSIGFGRPLLRWHAKRSGTEFVLSALPLGGYVRMLDEREGPVAEVEKSLAFNRQPLWARAATVAAGPVANLLLAALLYTLVAWTGVNEPLAVLSTPVPQSLAAQAQLEGGERVLGLARDGEAPRPVRSFPDLQWQLAQAALAGQDVRLQLDPGSAHAPPREVALPLSRLSGQQTDPAFYRRLGIWAPWAAPVLGEVRPDGAAFEAGLKPGDVVTAVNGRPVRDAQQLRNAIRDAVDASGQPQSQRWEVQRQGHLGTLNVTPCPEREGELWIGRIGAMVGGEPESQRVRSGLWEGIVHGFAKTGEISALMVQMLGKMVVGEASLKNISGPLTIADYAGRSADQGFTAYLQFLALISVSLGVLNLLPLPVLDGGHLMYYLWEGVTGRPVSELWLERLQRGGMVVLFALMSLALFNDVARLLG